MNLWPDAPNLQAHYGDLSRTFEENGSSLLELCKSFVETVCITIVKELGGILPINSSPSTTEYLGAALDALGLRNERGASALGKIVSGHNKLADGLSDARNNEGSVAHGKDGFLDAISKRHARVYVLSADTILSLLLSAYESVEPSVLHTREPHSRYEHHNKRIDAATAIAAEVDDEGMLVLSIRTSAPEKDESINLRLSTSEVLYYLDRQAYIDVLNALNGTPRVEDEELDGDGQLDKEEASSGIKLPSSDLAVERVAETAPSTKVSDLLSPLHEYHGRYAEKVGLLYDYIIHQLLDGDDSKAEQVRNFVFTALHGMEQLGVVDWSQRDSTRSSVRLFLRKLTVLFSIDGLDSDSIDGMVRWLATQIDGNGT